ncbi:MAG: HYR domain-containing protein [Saprospiraceae bacterium]
MEVNSTCSPCTKRIVRTWWITETTCNPRTPKVLIQNIDVSDFTPPDVTCPSSVTVNTNQFNCSTNYTFPKPVVSDNCQSVDDFEWDIAFSNPDLPPQSFIDNADLNNAPTRSLGEGVNTVTYTVYDGCGNSSSCSYTVTVVDQVQPVAICQSYTVTSLTYDGEAQIPATAVNSGSYDNCSSVSFAIKKMDSNDPFAEYVTFDCDDLNQTNVVILQVTDESGNESSCMVNVELQDKLPPTIDCPDDYTVACDYAYDEEDLTKYFGFATAHDNCSYEITTDSSTVTNACYDNPVQIITRNFTATDNGGRTANCTQKIYFVKTQYFGYVGSSTTGDAYGQIEWPEDVYVTTCADPTSASQSNSPLNPNQSGFPVLDEYACDQVGFTYSDFVFVDNDDNLDNVEACFKIIRTWTVIDDCHKVDGKFVKWTYDQTLFVTNSVDPVIVATPDKTVCTYDETCSTGEIELEYTASDDCTQNEDLRWRYRLDYDNDNATNVWDYTSPTFTGNQLNASGEYSIGTHKILWEVWDQCGNIASQEQVFTIENCKKPTPICIDGLTVDLTEDADPNQAGSAVILNAKMFNACCGNGSYHVCGYPLVFSFSSDTTEKSRTYTCDSIGLNSVEMWVSAILPDGSIIQDYCTTSIEVQDNFDVCDGSPLVSGTIAGNIKTEDNRELEGISVKLLGSEINDESTNIDGNYEFSQVPFGSSFAVQPVSTNDYLNGLSTLDIVMMQKHLLGIKKFSSAYDYIAADINKDNKFSASDIQQLRKLILGQTDRFESNNSWRFISNELGMDDTDNPLNGQFSETLPFTDLNSDIAANFTAVKVGDISGDALVNGLEGLEVRNSESVEFVVDNAVFEVGNEVFVPVYAKDYNDVIGFQGTFKFNSNVLVFEGIEAASIDNSNINIATNRLENGLIPVSCNFNYANNYADDEVLFVLKFNAVKSGEIAGNINLDSAITKKEAYNANYEVKDVNMTVRNINTGFELYQNQPNPFTYDTDILFNIDKSESYTLTIYDVTGKLIFEQKGTANEGMNKISINKTDLQGNGILYYSIRTKDYSATRKMVLIK